MPLPLMNMRNDVVALMIARKELVRSEGFYELGMFDRANRVAGLAVRDLHWGDPTTVEENLVVDNCQLTRIRLMEMVDKTEKLL